MSDRTTLETVGTFMGVPASRDLTTSKAAVLSIPIDCGFHPTRIGSRLRPQSLIPGVELDSLGIPAVLAHIRRRLAGKPVYLCFDMDVFDPSVAPGVCTPGWGGLNAEEDLAILDGLAELDFVAFDVNTVSPPHDSAGMTAFLAGTVMHKCLQLACAGLERRRSNQLAR